MHSLSRRRFLQTVGVASVVGLAGCSGASGSSTGGDDASGSRETTDLPLADESLSVQYGIDTLTGEVQSGGPPKDGIPSIDDPKFVDGEAGDDFLDPGDVVFGYAGSDDVRAYPQSILVHHEIVNDTLDGNPVSVTYCPLTGTAMGFDRGGVEFGVSGNLLNNNLVMYDRATDSRWPQILGTAISGPFRTESLREFRLVWTTWGQWKARYPETKLLSEDTGFPRNYDNDPYGRYNPKGGYYDSPGTIFGTLVEDDRYPDKDIVMGVRTPAGAVSFHKKTLRDRGVLEGELAGTPLTAVYDEGLDTAYVYRNPDEVSVSVDGETVSMDGESYRPDTVPLERVYTFDAMWFAWSGFYPDAEVFA